MKSLFDIISYNIVLNEETNFISLDISKLFLFIFAFESNDIKKSKIALKKRNLILFLYEFPSFF